METFENQKYENADLTHDAGSLLEDFIFGNLQPSSPLDPIVNCICNSMQTDKIFLLGTYLAFPESFGLEYDLLVLVDSGYKKPMHEFESLIANRCHDLAMVTASVHKTNTINLLLKQGNIFFTALCDPGGSIFDNCRIAQVKPESQYFQPNCENLITEFILLLAKAKSFLSGAFSYRITGDSQLAAFMLHQTVEHGLNAFLTPLIGYRQQTHNLNKLLLYARRLSRKFYTVFPRNTDAEIQLYQTLHKAYIYGRYKNNFLIGKEALQILTERATLLLDLTEFIFYQKIDELRLKYESSSNP